MRVIYTLIQHTHHHNVYTVELNAWKSVVGKEFPNPNKELKLKIRFIILILQQCNASGQLQYLFNSLETWELTWRLTYNNAANIHADIFKTSWLVNVCNKQSLHICPSIWDFVRLLCWTEKGRNSAGLQVKTGKPSLMGDIHSLSKYGLDFDKEHLIWSWLTTRNPSKWAKGEAIDASHLSSFGVFSLSLGISREIDVECSLIVPSPPGS